VGALLLAALAGAVAVAVAAYGWYRNQKRIDALAQFCLAKGWQWSSEDTGLTMRWTGPPFDEGFDRRARDVVAGRVGDRPFVAFDYSYVTETSNGKGGRSRETHHYAICAASMPAFLPPLQVTPESALTRMGRLVGLDDIDLESEDFNRRFRVSARDPKFASDVLPPRTMEMLLSRPSLHFRIAGSDVLCWETGTTTPTNLLARSSTLAAFVAGIPSFVWHDHGVADGPATASVAPPVDTMVEPQAPPPVPPPGGAAT